MSNLTVVISLSTTGGVLQIFGALARNNVKSKQVRNTKYTNNNGGQIHKQETFEAIRSSQHTQLFSTTDTSVKHEERIVALEAERPASYVINKSTESADSFFR
jgi:hypothetical protein